MKMRVLALILVPLFFSACVTTKTVHKRRLKEDVKELKEPIEARVMSDVGDVQTPVAAQHAMIADLMEAHLAKNTKFDLRVRDSVETSKPLFANSVEAHLAQSTVSNLTQDSAKPKIAIRTGKSSVFFRGHLASIEPGESGSSSLFTVTAFKRDGQLLASKAIRGTWPNLITSGMTELLKTEALQKQESTYTQTTKTWVNYTEVVEEPNSTGTLFLISGGIALITLIVLSSP